jgi:hypothetical protein
MIYKSSKKVAANFAANDILVCREILPRRCRDFFCNITATFSNIIAMTLFGNSIATFAAALP